MDPIQRQEFQHEASLMVNLISHPNVVKLYGVSLQPMAIITEFCQLYVFFVSFIYK